jgi:hypothetical protein
MEAGGDAGDTAELRIGDAPDRDFVEDHGLQGP